MTEADWLACENPMLLFELVRARDLNRKHLLFACACYRRSLARPLDDLAWKAVEIAERHADGYAPRSELLRAERSSHSACWHLVSTTGSAAAFELVKDAMIES